MTFATVLAFLSDLWFKFGVPIVLPHFVGWLTIKEKDYFAIGKASADVVAIGNAALMAVSSTEQEYVDAIKKANADGVITDDEKKQAYNIAANKFKSIVFNQLGEAVAKKISDSDTKTFVEGALKLLKARL